MTKVTEAHDMSADIYDEMSERLECHGHEALFGMSYEFMTPGESLLDIGIGTGLSSYLYHKAGLKVYGIDDSEKMLEACRKRAFATSLKKYNVNDGSWPYADGQFDHATACGLFHFYDKLDVFFSEVTRV